MDPITIAMCLAQFAPKIAKWLGGDNAEEVAQKVLDIANQVTGTTNPQPGIIPALSPEQQVEFRKAIDDAALELEKLALANATDVNETMRAEASSEHWPTWSWRPFIGFVFGLNILFSVVIVGSVYVMAMTGNDYAVKSLAMLPDMLQALVALNGTALPILGIASWFRGRMQADPNIPDPVRLPFRAPKP